MFIYLYYNERRRNKKQDNPVETAEQIHNVMKEVCDLANDSCKQAINEFEQDNNIVKLVTKVFDSIEKCDTDKCILNKEELYKKLTDSLPK